ncbi:F-box only protein 41-like [Synchiropus splendidus]|uniref:F-box only protein 41-like n=1 Tax=Synchiropus splendidus TaxID=270530 RepID=UPI00237DDBDB|nr:F-box only protein 41-like [Synchiropus splendidus]
MSSSISSPACLEMPYFCPRCGDQFRFSSVPELRAHLVSQHTYETLLMLSQARVRSSRPGALLPLPGPAAFQKQASSQDTEPHSLSLPLACLDLASSSASGKLLSDLFNPVDRSLGDSQTKPSLMLALPGPLEAFPGRRLGDMALQLGLDRGVSVSIGLEERLGLGLDRSISKTLAQVEEKVNRRMGRLMVALKRREASLERERRTGEQLKKEKLEVEKQVVHLSKQVSVAMEMTEKLKAELQGREKELSEQQQEMEGIERFLRETAVKEAEAKSRLQVFIETLLDRADRAERQLLKLSSQDRYTPLLCRGGRSLDASTDDFLDNKAHEVIGNRRSFSVSGSYRLGEQLHGLHPCSGDSGRMRTASLGSEFWNIQESICRHPLAPSWSNSEKGRVTDRRERFWVGESGWGQTWSKNSRRQHSTDEDDEEEEEEEEGPWSRAELRRHIFSRTHTPGSELPSSTRSSPSLRCGSDRQLEADTLRLRAALFCVFPYLDVSSLLRAAEVCSDWRFVARHPAVWTRVRLESARVSSQFLITLSQWCTQTQCVELNNLKPRSRRPEESQEEYHNDIRGSLEPGLEALLRSAGGSLFHLSIAQCPDILTDRSMWLVSCYCRNLNTLVYRSSTDPLGQEVLWALGASCRSICSLHVAPSHPCLQSTHFGSRCLQMIGRCWPHLRSLSVGGAGCGTQGLVSVVRSCAHLQVLALERINDLGLQAATELCNAGLRSLQTLILTHTPVSGQAILHFHGCCANIRQITVEISADDYFEDTDTEESKHLYGEILSTLKILQTRPGLSEVLQIKVT